MQLPTGVRRFGVRRCPSAAWLAEALGTRRAGFVWAHLRAEVFRTIKYKRLE